MKNLKIPEKNVKFQRKKFETARCQIVERQLWSPKTDFYKKNLLITFSLWKLDLGAFKRQPLEWTQLFNFRFHFLHKTKMKLEIKNFI